MSQYRIFLVTVDGSDYYLTHHSKTEEDFHKDLKSFGSETKNVEPATIIKGLKQFLENEGYVDINDFVIARYNATILSTRSRLIEQVQTDVRTR